MNNPDVLRTILLKCDDQTLDKLVLTSLWPTIRGILQDPHFWYLRTEILTGMELEHIPGADWNKIYYLIRTLMTTRTNVGTIDTLSEAEVITEVFGETFWVRNVRRWKGTDEGITSVEVAKYLIENNYLDTDKLVANTMFLTGARDLKELAIYLMELAEAADIEREELHEYLFSGMRGAVFGDNLDIYLYFESKMLELAVEDINFRWILEDLGKVGGPKITRRIVEHGTVDDDALEALISSSIRRGRADILRAILAHVDADYASNTSLDYITDEVIEAARSGHTDVIDVLIDYTSVKPEDILTLGIGQRNEVLIKYGLALVEDPSYEDNRALLTAVSSDYIAGIKLLLQDSRLDPSLNIDEMAGSALELREMSSIDLVIGDQRIDVEELEVTTLRTIIHILYSRIVPALEGFAYGNGIAGGEHVTDLLIGLEQASTDINSALLKLLVIKRPTGREIFAWLARSNYPKTVLEGTRSIQNRKLKCSDKAIPVRELMLAIVYPTMTVKEVNSVLKSEGVDRETIILACRLVGTYIGYRDRVKA